MAKNYGDIPTCTLGKIKHITKSASECLCGAKWSYGTINRQGKSFNITFRSLESVTCEKCKEIYES